MSAARARRRLMAHERYRRRALLLGLPYSLMTPGHSRAWGRTVRASPFPRRRPWTLPDPPLHLRRSR